MRSVARQRRPQALSRASGLSLILPNAVASKKYIERLQMVISQLHGADSTHVESVPVLETFNGKTIWEGVVEVFDLSNHQKSAQCYAWSYREKGDEHFTAVLKSPPVNSPQDAVKAAVATHIRKST